MFVISTFFVNKKKMIYSFVLLPNNYLSMDHWIQCMVSFLSLTLIFKSESCLILRSNLFVGYLLHACSHASLL